MADIPKEGIIDWLVEKPLDSEHIDKMSKIMMNKGKSLTISPTTISFAKCEWIIDPISENFIWPQKGEKDSAAFDLFYCGEDIRIDPVGLSGETQKILLGFRAKISSGWCAKILMRSGLALKYNLGLANSVGLIDSSYRQEWALLLINRSKDFYYLKKGTAIAQVVFEPVYNVDIVKWNSSNQWYDSDRKGGFGSTGNH